MDKVEVSVIVPFYNAERFLSETLDALRIQTFKNIEVILVDDGSTDHSAIIADEYCSCNEGFEVIHIENTGVYNARLIGISQAKGNYVAFCDSDDIPLPTMIERMHSNAIETGADMIVCGYYREDMQSGNILSREMISLGNKQYCIPDEIYVLQVVNSAIWNKLFKKEVILHHIKFDYSPNKLEDVMFLCSLYPFIHNISFIPEALYKYRVHSGSLITEIKEEEMEFIRRDMIQTREYMKDNSSDKRMLIACDCIAFIHFGLSVVIRQVQAGERCITAIKQAKEYLDCNFPYYKQTGMNLLWNIVHKNMLIKPLVARWLFNTKVTMIMFLKLYNYITKKLEIDIKW